MLYASVLLVLAVSASTTTSRVIDGVRGDLDLLDVHCDAEHLFVSGECVCGETPCFHYEVILHFRRGNELPHPLRRMLRIVWEIVDLRQNPTPYDSSFFQGLPDLYREKVSELALVCREINLNILSESAFDDISDDAWTDFDIEIGHREILLEFLEVQICELDKPYNDLLEIVETVWADEVVYVSNMEIPILLSYVS